MYLQKIEKYIYILLNKKKQVTRFLLDQFTYNGK